jgi:thioredoxin-related protein
MVRQLILPVFCSLLISGTAVAQADLHPIAQADSLEQINSKPMVVLLSAPWCNWCQKMKMQSLSDKRLDASMNERF